MPTVIVLDTSSTMNVVKPGDTFTPLQIAFSGLHALLDKIAATSRLEFVALVTYSTHFEIISSFTRDYDLLKLKIMQLKLTDEFELKNVMESLQIFVVEEWGGGISCNVIVVAQDKYALEACSIPLTLFSGNILICSLGPENIKPELTPKLEHQNYKCALYQPNLPVNLVAIQQIFTNIAEKYYSIWVGQLICGHFNSRISLTPSPEPHYVATDFDSSIYTVDTVIEICGFIQLQHLGSPGAVSRHLVLPYNPTNPYPVGRPSHSRTHSTPPGSDDEFDEGSVPSFVVLLLNGLKVENMAAMCSVGSDWYGILFCWADSKKKSNLMLSLLEPGSTDAIPWLGDLNKLTLSSSPSEVVPVKSTEKKSYTQNCVAWIQQQGLQSDIQKILRHSRKLPEKTQQFYKELNRVRRAAIGLGFMSLIDGLAAVLERECTLLPGTAHPACALQLTHAAGVLREPHARDHKYNILPMKTSFSDSGFDLF